MPCKDGVVVDFLSSVLHDCAVIVGTLSSVSRDCGRGWHVKFTVACQCGRGWHVTADHTTMCEIVRHGHICKYCSSTCEIRDEKNIGVDD